MSPHKFFVFWVPICWLCSGFCYKFGEELFPGDVEIPGWGVNVSRNVSEYVDIFRNTAIFPGTGVCQPETEIVIVVVTKWQNAETRKLIRETWGKEGRPKVRVGFILGYVQNNAAQRILEEESFPFGDIIQENFIDSYYNLTIKSLSILKWFIRTCPKAKYLMKADDDTFVNVQHLADKLGRAPKTGVLAGSLCSGFNRDTRKSSSWYAPKYMYNDNVYPDFLQGSAYYMSRDVAVRLLQAAMTTPVFHLEDVYVTGLCSQAAGVKLTRDPSVLYLFGYHPLFCFFGNFLTCNSVEPEKLGLMYKTLNDLRRSSKCGHGVNCNPATSFKALPYPPFRSGMPEIDFPIKKTL